MAANEGEVMLKEESEEEGVIPASEKGQCRQRQKEEEEISKS